MSHKGVAWVKECISEKISKVITAYHLWDPASSCVFNSYHVTFFEHLDATPSHLLPGTVLRTDCTSSPPSWKVTGPHSISNHSPNPSPSPTFPFSYFLMTLIFQMMIKQMFLPTLHINLLSHCPKLITKTPLDQMIVYRTLIIPMHISNHQMKNTKMDNNNHQLNNNNCRKVTFLASP